MRSVWSVCRHVLRGQAERAGAVLVDLEPHAVDGSSHSSCGVEAFAVAAHDVAHLLGDLADLRRIRADHAELHREADRRAEIEAVDPHPRRRHGALADRRLEAGLDALAGFDDRATG